MRKVCCYAGSPRGVTVDVGHIWAVSGRGLKGHHHVAATTLASDTKGSCRRGKIQQHGFGHRRCERPIFFIVEKLYLASAASKQITA